MTEQQMRLASASCLLSKAKWAAFQTGELCRTKTIVSVNADEALVMEWAVERYIEECRKELERRGEL